MYCSKQYIGSLIDRQACTNFWKKVGRYLSIMCTLSLFWSAARLLGRLPTLQVTLSSGSQEEEPSQEEPLPQSLDQLGKEAAEGWGMEHIWGNNLSGESYQKGVYPVLPRSSVLESQVPKNSQPQSAVLF